LPRPIEGSKALPLRFWTNVCSFLPKTSRIPRGKKRARPHGRAEAMRCASCIRCFITTVGVALTLAAAVRLGTDPAAATDWPPGPCAGKQPKPVCGRGSVAVCTRPTAGSPCGCMRWTCAFKVPRPPMTKEPLKPPKPLPGWRNR
jgi:hypothetical protein